MITKEQIISLCDEALNGTDRFVVEVKVKAGNVITIFIDADSLVSIDNCVELSRFIEGQLDRDVEDYELNVSSAGLDNPLRLPRQFQKHLGEDVVIKLTTGGKTSGKLVGFDNNGIQLEEKANRRKKNVEPATIRLEFLEIAEIKLEIKF